MVCHVTGRLKLYWKTNFLIYGVNILSVAKCSAVSADKKKLPSLKNHPYDTCILVLQVQEKTCEIKTEMGRYTGIFRTGKKWHFEN